MNKKDILLYIGSAVAIGIPLYILLKAISAKAEKPTQTQSPTAQTTTPTTTQTMTYPYQTIFTPEISVTIKASRNYVNEFTKTNVCVYLNGHLYEGDEPYKLYIDGNEYKTTTDSCVTLDYYTLKHNGSPLTDEHKVYVILYGKKSNVLTIYTTTHTQPTHTQTAITYTPAQLNLRIEPDKTTLHKSDKITFSVFVNNKPYNLSKPYVIYISGYKYKESNSPQFTITEDDLRKVSYPNLYGSYTIYVMFGNTKSNEVLIYVYPYGVVK